MTLHTLLLVLHTVFAAGLWWSCFCRATRMSKATRWEIRAVFWALGGAALFAGFAPFLFGEQAELTDVLLLGAFLLVQWVTGRYWQRGTPREFEQ
jgi:hypothetical protein